MGARTKNGFGKVSQKLFIHLALYLIIGYNNREGRQIMVKRFGQFRPMVHYLLSMIAIGIFFWLLCSLVITLLLAVQATFSTVKASFSPVEIFVGVGLIVLFSIAWLYYKNFSATRFLVKRGLTWQEAEFAVFGKALHKYYKFQDMSLSEIRDKLYFWQKTTP